MRKNNGKMRRSYTNTNNGRWGDERYIKLWGWVVGLVQRGSIGSRVNGRETRGSMIREVYEEAERYFLHVGYGKLDEPVNKPLKFIHRGKKISLSYIK